MTVSKSTAAAILGAMGGKSRSPAKLAAVKANSQSRRVCKRCQGDRVRDKKLRRLVCLKCDLKGE